MGVGTAKVTLAFDAWYDGNVASSRHEIEIVAARYHPKLEPVSQRLKAVLQHPAREGVLDGLRYSPDG